MLPFPSTCGAPGRRFSICAFPCLPLSCSALQDSPQVGRISPAWPEGQLNERAELSSPICPHSLAGKDQCGPRRRAHGAGVWFPGMLKLSGSSLWPSPGLTPENDLPLLGSLPSLSNLLAKIPYPSREAAVCQLLRKATVDKAGVTTGNRGWETETSL